VLLEAIAAFSGTVVFVSHDRYFIDRLATRVLEVEGGTVTSHEGNYEDYLRWKESQSAGGPSQVSSHPDHDKKSVILSDRSAAKGVEGPASPPRPTGNAASSALYQGTTSVVPQSGSTRNGALAPASPATIGATIVIEGGPDDAARRRRLNPIKQKQLEDRCAFLEEEIPRFEASIAHTEEQLGVYVSAAETARLTALAEDLRRQLASLTTEWEDLTMQLEGV
jgi:ATP-binding cassette subfamily F protein 3